MIISCFVLSTQSLQALARLCVEHDVIAIADDVYENTIFPAAGSGCGDDDGHTPLATLDGMRERTLTIGSASKVRRHALFFLVELAELFLSERMFQLAPSHAYSSTYRSSDLTRCPRRRRAA
jgi:hypothetical protein